MPAPHALHISALASSPVSFAASTSPRRLLGLMASAVSAAAICLSVLTVSPARAATVTFVTPTGSTVNDGAGNASASFITGPGSISVTLTDLLANPKSVGQLLGDISFTFTGGLASNASLVSGTGQEIAVASDGTFTTGASVAAGWGLSAVGTSTLHLDALGQQTSPEHLLIGPAGAGGTYSNANGSIADNRPHNPFLNQTASFAIALMNTTTTPTITGVTFSFGTTEGAELVADPLGDPPTPFAANPIPAALPLFATGLGGLGLLAWRRKRKKRRRLSH
jgi:hypothetical protein